MTWIVLTSRGCRVALPASEISRIVENHRVVRVPLAAPGVAGVAAIEGRAVPLYRLEDIPVRSALPDARAGRPAGSAGPDQIVVIEQEGALAGLLVEETSPLHGDAGPDDAASSARELLAAAGVYVEGGPDQTAADAARGES
ncbi:MAG TPA: chemotaxis protein CheW [Candidatus Polarisedimenticolia bacterium]|nr:chemotaxis protein CheW [Candidatus Polarisedimenticolia bacterium]